jgi:hypothetical protein
MRATVFFRLLMMKDLKYKVRTFLAILVALVAVFVVNANVEPCDGNACDSDSDGDTVDAGTLNNKIMAGCQGWFNAAGDGAGRGWRHWGNGSGNTPNADNITIDMWPDLREYDADELYNTDFKYSNGSTAGL